MDANMLMDQDLTRWGCRVDGTVFDADDDDFDIDVIEELGKQMAEKAEELAAVLVKLRKMMAIADAE